MIEDYQYVNRVGHIELDVGNGKFKSFKGLDFKFDVSKIAGGGVLNYAKIGLLGLNRNTVNDLSTYLSVAHQTKNPRMIKVYAGYEQTGEQLIFAGDMIFAKPSQPVDNWLNIDAQVAGWLRGAIVSVSESGSSTLKSIIENIAKEFDMDIVYLCNPNDEYLTINVPTFDCNGNFHDIIKRFNTLNPYIKASVEFSRNSNKGNAYAIHVYKYDIAPPEATSRLFKLNYKTGLIGVPQFTYPSVNFRILMNPYIHIMDYVRLDSVLIPNAGGIFKIMSIKYTGHFRGTPWYMDCVGQYCK
jgi:hypothetical protein